MNTPPGIAFHKADLNKTEELISKIPVTPASKEELGLALSLIDLTSLEGSDRTETINQLCNKAVEMKTAAVCVYPAMVSIAKKELNNTNVKVASVAGGFPAGQLPLQLRIEEALFAIKEGADEIDMVISRGKFLEGDYQFIHDEIKAFRKVCGPLKLKVILETGELITADNIRRASDIALHAGADFIKTSTGKISVNASLFSVCIMLQAIRDFTQSTGKRCGIKPSGGIADGAAAVKYLRLTEMMLGKEWLDPALFRFGASRLADKLNGELLGNKQINNTKDGY